MSNEPDVGFSNKAGGMNPPGIYCYPIGFGGSTKEKLVCKYITLLVVTHMKEEILVT